MERESRPPFDPAPLLAAYRQAAERAAQHPTDRTRRRVAEAEAHLIGVLTVVPGRFELGQLVATPGALTAIAHAGQIPPEFLLRHKFGDFGALPPEDLAANEQAVRDGFRVFSAYRTCRDEPLWCITEADRSATTLLLPDEY